MITTLALAVAMATADGITMTFVPSGAVAKAGGYSPIRCPITANDAGIKMKPAGLANPRYGKIAVGTRSFALILDEPAGKPASLYVDSNGDGDLTNDSATWVLGQNKMYNGSATVDIGKGTPVGIKLYRFDPADPSRAALKDTVLYYFDFGYEVAMTLDGTTSKSFIVGEPGPQTTLRVDRNGDGKFSYKRETVTVGKPFNFTGTTYVLKSDGGKLALEKSVATVPQTPLPPDLGNGKKALTFTATDLDGKKVNFPGDYKGKIVMLDFWATWCGPCIAELPNVKAAYEKHHASGFEILGISFDQKDMAEKVRSFTAQNGMPWRHVYEGKYWDTELGGLYDVGAIPFVLLVDGDTGEIIAQVSQLRGPGIVNTIEAALAKKKSGK
jgi:thiol-disulfide isomerase/thioredoxin